MLASAPVAARRPLQISRLTISLSTYPHLPAPSGGVNHLALAAVGICSPALEELPVDGVGPVTIDRVEGSVAPAGQLPDANQLVAGGGLGQHVGVGDRDHVVVFRVQDEDRHAGVC